MRSASLACFLLALFLSGGCGGTRRIEIPAINPGEAAAKAMAAYDANRDGFLDAHELDKCPALKGALDRLDTNKDRKISQAELEQRFVEYQHSGVGLFAAAVKVTLDGKAAEAVSVELEPEAFMGSIKPAHGVTDANGKAALMIAGDTGCHFGFYRVRLSRKDGAPLPARYGDGSKLGMEIGPNIRSGDTTVFKLTSK